MNKLSFLLFTLLLVGFTSCAKQAADNTADAQSGEKTTLVPTTEGNSVIDDLANPENTAIVNDIIKKMNEKITLTDAQEQQIREMAATFGGKQSGSEAETRAAFREYRRRVMREVLTPEQVQTLRAARKGGK